MRSALELPGLEHVADPARAEAIIFCEDDPGYIRRSDLYAKYPEKSLVVSGIDRPTFYLPAIYSSNHRNFFGRGRTLTCDYFMDEPNPYLAEFKDARLPKKWLLSFVGGSTSWPRKHLFRLRERLAAHDVFIKSTDDYEHWTNDEGYLPTKRGRQKAYAEIMAQSSFFLCPRGVGHSSIRLFEVMEMGGCPIIVADGWIPPEGPDWSSFALFLPESRIGSCVEMAHGNLAQAPEMGRRARENFDRYFSETARAGRLREQVTSVLSSRRVARERVIHRVYFLRTLSSSMRAWSYRVLKRITLGFFKLIGRKFPYQLNRPS